LNINNLSFRSKINALYSILFALKSLHIPKFCLPLSHQSNDAAIKTYNKMTATHFEILESQFKEVFQNYGVANIRDGKIISAHKVPHEEKESILAFAAQLERPCINHVEVVLVGEDKKAAMTFCTSIIDGNPYLTTVTIPGCDMVQIEASKRKEFLVWFKEGMERFSIDERDINEK
jgi:hypothetical protein